MVVAGFFYLDMPQSAPAPQTVNVLPRLSGDNLVCGVVTISHCGSFSLSLRRSKEKQQQFACTESLHRRLVSLVSYSVSQTDRRVFPVGNSALCSVLCLRELCTSYRRAFHALRQASKKEKERSAEA